MNLKIIEELNTEEKNYKAQETAETSEKNGTEIRSEASSWIFENKENREWLTTKEAAEYLRVNPKSLLNQTSNGKIRHFKYGRRNRFLLSDLRELLLAQPRGRTYGN